MLFADRRREIRNVAQGASETEKVLATSSIPEELAYMEFGSNVSAVPESMGWAGCTGVLMVGA